jgi:DNA polymerase I-like protein with 3'-5' exonuclease and polymerase domains
MAVAKKKDPNALQLPLFAPESTWRAPNLAELPSWAEAQRVAVDVETRDPGLKTLGPGVRRANSYVVGYSFAIDSGPAFYVPLRHLGGDNVDNPELGWAYLRDQAKIFTGEIVGQNLSYDLDWLAQNGVVFRRARKFRDIMIAEALIHELHNSYSMAANAERRGLLPKNEAKLREAADHYGVDPKGELWKLPARFVGEYGERDAHLPLQILKLQEQDIAKQDLHQIWDIESDLLPILVKMRRRGVRIDWDKLESIERWTLEEEQAALEAVYSETGQRIAVGDVWKAGALAPALEQVGIKLAKTEKTAAPQIDKALLASGAHPILDSLGWARKVNKLRTTFAQSIHTFATNGRIHCTLNQIFGEREDGSTRGARFGRMSCEDPNLQQQPSRDEFAKDWRSIYIPEEGALWACADFSQQEPRWAAHFAHLLNLPGAADMVRRYNEDPKTDNHTLMAEITKLPRNHAKIVFLGIMYGEGGPKLCHDMGLSTQMMVVHKGVRYPVESPDAVRAMALGGRRQLCAGPEGQEILDRFDQNAPFVKGLSRKCEEVVKNRGHIITVLGRRCRFPLDANGNPDWTYRALNRLIQGSAGDQVKKAMIDVDREGCYLQLQVHDELDFSTPSKEEAEKIGVIMRESVKASLPFKVDVEIGPSWGQIA